MTSHRNGLTIRPTTGPGELGLFNRFPHQFNAELAGDLRDAADSRGARCERRDG